MPLRQVPSSSSPRIDGIEFFTNAANAGGAFMLNEASTTSAVETIEGWETEVRAGSRIVVARGTGPESFEHATAESIDAANRGLDMLSARGILDAWIREADDQHISWWAENGEQVIRLVSVPTARVDVGNVTVTGGIQVEPAAPEWHESLRYFRLSQITDDLVDAYRNLYLALECLLSRLAPQRSNPNGSPTENEGDWLKRALGEAGQLVNLESYVPPGAGDPVATLFDDLYRDIRSNLLHAKSSRPTILPHTGARRGEVAASLQRATSLYLGLAEHELHVRRPGGGIFAGLWRMQTDSLVGRLKIVATDDSAAISPDDDVVNPAGGAIVELETCAAPEYDQPFERAFLGRVAGRELGTLDPVTRVCTVVDDAPYSAHTPEGELRIDQVDRFEALVILRAENVRQPKRRYAS